MSKTLDDILLDMVLDHINFGSDYESDEAFSEDKAKAKADIKALFKELVGELEQRETSDMSLKSWSTDDYKAFGRNEIKIELHNKIDSL